MSFQSDIVRLGEMALLKGAIFLKEGEKTQGDVLLPIGGGDEVGASSLMLRFGGRRILLDAGRRFGSFRVHPRYDAACSALGMDGLWELDAILLSHAHGDHVGSLDRVVGEAPIVSLYATRVTLDVTEIMLAEALLRRSSASRKDDSRLLVRSTVERTLSGGHPKEFGEAFQIGPVSVRLFRAGHIPGAAMIHLESPSHSLLYTGDFCDFDQFTVRGCSLPEDLEVDTLIAEATYEERDDCATDSGSIERRRAELLRIVAAALKSNGSVIVHAGVIGKAQEAAALLARGCEEGFLTETPIWIDGTAKKIAECFVKCGVPLFEPSVHSSDTLSTGRPKQGILIVGEADLEQAKSRFGQETPIISAASLPTHAGRLAVLEMVDRLRPSSVILVHRNRNAGEGADLRQELLERHGSCISVEYARNGVLMPLPKRSSLRPHDHDPVAAGTGRPKSKEDEQE